MSRDQAGNVCVCVCVFMRMRADTWAGQPDIVRALVMIKTPRGDVTSNQGV